ncbi:sensor histidine kinase [Plantactinospora siamensis]|uniref:histidine kinase n=1 Tax=Plantactinospora siamensis TaxID=555372 RepID=A0ABV6P258_9ACTN
MLGATDRAPGARRLTRSVLGLAALTWAILGGPPPPSGGRTVVLLVLVAIAGLGWVVMALRLGDPRAWLAAALACGGAGILVVVVGDRYLGVFYPAVACLVAGATFGLAVSVGLTAVLLVALVVTEAATGTPLVALGLSAGYLLLGLLLGVIRRQREQQSEQRELLLVETEHAREERARAAALAERARLAREIHDVLAHSLSALSVQLETAAALLEHDRIRQAAEVVDQAGRIAREGLAETRRAVTALRGDPLPLPELVATLAEAHGADVGEPVEVRVTGTPRPLSAESGHALYRAAQEALTNVRKHAPNARVEIDLSYRPEEVRLTITDDGGPGAADRPPDATRRPPDATRRPPDDADRPPDGAPTGAAGRSRGAGLPPGYGLTGLRERVELAGGTVETGPLGAGWRVDVRMPG